MLDLEIVTEVSRLESLPNEWDKLAELVPCATPFQTPEWLLTWWKHFGSGEPRILLFRERGKLVGLIPAFLHEWEDKRQITLFGSGISDYLDPLLAPDTACEIANCLFGYLRCATEWDVCNWQDLSRNDLLNASVPRELVIESVPETPCSAIRIEGTFGDYWQKRPSGLRRNVRRYRQKAEQVAALTSETSASANREYLDTLIRLHSARWREQGEPGMIAANRSAAFLREVVEKLAGRELVRFFILRFQGAIAAVILGLPYRNTIYAYLSAFDPAYSAFGFGRLLLFHALEYAFANNFQKWDFLRGSEGYKFEWGAEEIPKTRLLITRAHRCVDDGSIKV